MKIGRESCDRFYGGYAGQINVCVRLLLFFFIVKKSANISYTIVYNPERMAAVINFSPETFLISLP